MKFIKLESRGGNYLVVASNVAWLRTAENGQTTVGIVGGQPLLVVGSVEDVADKILRGLAQGDNETPPSPASMQQATPQNAKQADKASATSHPAPEPVHVSASAPEPAAPVEAPPAPVRPRPAAARSAAMWERSGNPATPALKLKSGSQRMMGMLE